MGTDGAEHIGPERADTNADDGSDTGMSWLSPTFADESRAGPLPHLTLGPYLAEHHLARARCSRSGSVAPSGMSPLVPVHARRHRSARIPAATSSALPIPSTTLR